MERLGRHRHRDEVRLCAADGACSSCSTWSATTCRWRSSASSTWSSASPASLRAAARAPGHRRLPRPQDPARVSRLHRPLTALVRRARFSRPGGRRGRAAARPRLRGGSARWRAPSAAIVAAHGPSAGPHGLAQPVGADPTPRSTVRTPRRAGRAPGRPSRRTRTPDSPWQPPEVAGVAHREHADDDVGQPPGDRRDGRRIRPGNAKSTVNAPLAGLDGRGPGAARPHAPAGRDRPQKYLVAEPVEPRAQLASQCCSIWSSSRGPRVGRRHAPVCWLGAGPGE